MYCPRTYKSCERNCGVPCPPRHQSSTGVGWIAGTFFALVVLVMIYALGSIPQ